MDVAGKGFPGLVHEAGALIKESLSVPIDRDSVGVDEHNRRGLAATRIDRLRVHAVPVTGERSAKGLREPNAVAGIKMSAGRKQFHGCRSGSEMLMHHVRAALKAAGGNDDSVRLNSPIAVSSCGRENVMARLTWSDMRCRTVVKDLHIGPTRDRRQTLDNRRAAAVGLDARRTDAEVVDWF